jgi:hypothetical protein
MNITKITCVAGLVLAAGVVGCNNDSITNLNQNPNSPPSAPPGPVFTNAARVAASRFVGNGFDLRQTEFVAQHWAEAQYPDEDRYARLDPSSTEGTFEGAYSSELKDFSGVIAAGRAASDPSIYGPAMVLTAWDYEYLTDTWGAIPFSQALAGDSVGGSLTPAFDPQKDVYTGLFTMLKTAATDLEGTNSSSLGAADPVYTGNPAQWAKFANSLRARLALRLVNVDPATANAELTAAFSDPGGVFTSNADMAKLVWPGDGIYNNPMTDNFSGRDDHRVSQTLANILFANHDPRVPIYMQPATDPSLAATDGYEGVYMGMPNGLTTADAGVYISLASRPGTYLWPGVTSVGTVGSAANKKLPSYYMTYSELAFIQAEAAERSLGGLNPSQAAGFYNAAITAAMTQRGVAAGDIATFLAQPTIAYKGGTAGLIQIATQKWVSMVDDGAQAWGEWRRTCQPSTVVAGPAAVVDYVPRRFYYPSDDYSLNGASVAAANAAQGADNFGTRIYWDTNPTAAPTYVSDQACAGTP